MVVLVTCKNEEDLIKNEGARVVKRKCGQTSGLPDFQTDAGSTGIL